MSESSSALVSMADIARLAGQSRSTVGNWKTRERDFPSPHSQGARGPLYEREEILAWLSKEGRLAETSLAHGEIYRSLVIDLAELAEVDVLLYFVAMVVLRLTVGGDDWRDLNLDQKLDELEPDSPPTWSIDISWNWRVIFDTTTSLETRSRLVADLEPLDDATLRLMLFDALRSFADRSHVNSAFTTPSSLCALLSRLSLGGTSYLDPASGLGLLLDAVQTAERRAFDNPKLVFFAQEVDPKVAALAEMVLATTGVPTDVQVGDVFLTDCFFKTEVDRIVTQPPVASRLAETTLDPDDPRWVFGEPGTSDFGVAWVQHCLYHLNDEGRAVIALPLRVLSDRSKSGRAMQAVVKAGYLDAVVSLPRRLLRETGIPMAVLVLRKGRERVEGKPAPTLMIQVDDTETIRVGGQLELPDSLIEELGDVYDEWVTGTLKPRLNVGEATYDQIVEQSFNLTPRLYQERLFAVDDVAAFNQEITETRSRIRSNLLKLSRIDDQLFGRRKGSKQ